MTRFIMPIILIGIAISLFFVFTNPVYNDISTLNASVTSYNDALDNSKALEAQRDQLTQKENSISVENLAKLQKLLPQNVDNVRLILEIGQIAQPYGMVLKDVKYDATTPDTTAMQTGEGAVQGGAVKTSPNGYGIFDLEFSTSGTYDNFINFTKDLESNLRIVDISSISFSSDETDANANKKTSSAETYTYDFKIKTYWLKN